MAFAGLWEVWRDPSGGGELLRSCAIITTDANGVLAPIHSRMPVVLPPDAWDQWLDPAFEDISTLAELLVPGPGDWFEAFTVSSRVNSVANEGPELLDPSPPPAGNGAGAVVQRSLF
jgi:putative SOS response-associated peptidase YedK